jgi:hypothetical protein
MKIRTGKFRDVSEFSEELEEEDLGLDISTGEN